MRIFSQGWSDGKDGPGLRWILYCRMQSELPGDRACGDACVFKRIAEFARGLECSIDSTEHLRKILSDPKKHAPSGVYIMRIHGTFVNFLDLSNAIQEDIIRRLNGGAA